MWNALRDLFANIPPEHRAGLAIALGIMLVGVLGLLAVLGLDLGPYWALLGG